ncbi:MAG: hypothetical protein NXI20_20295 [bacterium]|nr:hypothetical protein [bacterium]
MSAQTGITEEFLQDSLMEQNKNISTKVSIEQYSKEKKYKLINIKYEHQSGNREYTASAILPKSILGYFLSNYNFPDYKFSGESLFKGKVIDSKSVGKGVVIVTKDSTHFYESSQYQYYAYYYEDWRAPIKQLDIDAKGVHTNCLGMDVFTKVKMISEGKSLFMEVTSTSSSNCKNTGELKKTYVWKKDKNAFTLSDTEGSLNQGSYQSEGDWILSSFQRGNKIENPAPIALGNGTQIDLVNNSIVKFTETGYEFNLCGDQLQLTKLRSKPFSSLIDTILQIDGSTFETKFFESFRGNIFTKGDRVIMEGVSSDRYLKRLEFQNLSSPVSFESRKSVVPTYVWYYIKEGDLKNFQPLLDNNLLDLYQEYPFYKSNLSVSRSDYKSLIVISGHVPHAQLLHSKGKLGTTYDYYLKIAGSSEMKNWLKSLQKEAFKEEDEKIKKQIPGFIQSKFLTDNGLSEEQVNIKIDNYYDTDELQIHNIYLEINQLSIMYKSYFVIHKNVNGKWVALEHSYDMQGSEINAGTGQQVFTIGDQVFLYSEISNSFRSNEEIIHRISKFDINSGLIEPTNLEFEYHYDGSCSYTHKTYELDFTDVGEKLVRTVVEEITYKDCAEVYSSTSKKSYRWSSRQQKFLEALD